MSDSLNKYVIFTCFILHFLNIKYVHASIFGKRLKIPAYTGILKGASFLRTTPKEKLYIKVKYDCYDAGLGAFALSKEYVTCDKKNVAGQFLVPVDFESSRYIIPPIKTSFVRGTRIFFVVKFSVVNQAFEEVKELYTFSGFHGVYTKKKISQLSEVLKSINLDPILEIEKSKCSS